MGLFSFITDRVKSFFSDEPATPEEADHSGFFTREKVIAFSAALFISISLWLIVNLSRDFNVTIQVPIQIVNLPDDVALSNDVPEYASVNLTGEGWKLIPIYNNPPRISLTAETQEINLFDQMRNQVSAFSDLNVQQVDPLSIRIETELKATKRVPVYSRVELNMRNRYGAVQTPVLEPDSVTITGPESRLADISRWETAEIELRDVSSNVERTIDLRSSGSGIRVEPQTVNLRVEVAEFTESEVRVPVRTRNLPSGEAVTYNPSSITVRFDVPIDKFSEVQESRPFTAFVDYAALEADTTGFITPQIENSQEDINVRVRSFRPTQVSYFNIVQD